MIARTNSYSVIRAVTVSALTCAVVLVCVGTSSAATISSEAASGLSSAAVQNGTIYWFQRAPQFDEPEPGAIYARKLGSKRVAVVYRPPNGSSINAFNVRGGRIAVGIKALDETNGESAIIELTETATGYSSAKLVARSATRNGGDCGSLVELMNIDLTGSIIFEDASFVGQHDKCEVLRRSGVVKALSKTGQESQLSTRESGWALGKANSAPRALKAGPTSWYALRNSDFGVPGGEIGTYDISSGEQYPFPLASVNGVAELAEGNALLISTPTGSDSEYLLAPDPSNPARTQKISRPGSLVWMHFCGDTILEISRRKANRKRSAGGMWNIYLRELDGTVIRRLPQRLKRGTSFETCNADIAVFHSDLRKQRLRQFTLPLR